MEIESLPSSYDELIKILNENGSISFIIERHNKKRFRNNIQRLHKLEAMFQKKKKLSALIYGTYVGALKILNTTKDKNLENAITTYQVAQRHIKSIGGEDLPNNKIKVTYNARI